MPRRFLATFLDRRLPLYLCRPDVPPGVAPDLSPCVDHSWTPRTVWPCRVETGVLRRSSQSCRLNACRRVSSLSLSLSLSFPPTLALSFYFSLSLSFFPFLPPPFTRPLPLASWHAPLRWFRNPPGSPRLETCSLRGPVYSARTLTVRSVTVIAHTCLFLSPFTGTYSPLRPAYHLLLPDAPLGGTHSPLAGDRQGYARQSQQRGCRGGPGRNRE